MGKTRNQHRPAERGSLCIVVLCLVVLTFPSCLVASLHPVYDDESIVFDEALVGTWTNRESEVSAVLTRGEWKSYHLAYTDRFGTTQFTAHLTTLGPARLLNVRPEDGVERPAFVVASNGFMQVVLEADRLRVREPEYGVLLQRLNNRTLGVEAAMDLKQNILFTAPSAKVRAWLATALKDETLWADWKNFSRSAR
jgi:hypothetical protein